MPRLVMVATLLIFPWTAGAAQSPTDGFLGALRAHCGNAYAGQIINPQPGDTMFSNNALVMHVRECGDTVRIPFHVGTNRSRTWVLTKAGDGVRLKHDHRHEDGREDRVTQYGGDSGPDGTATTMSFPADSFTTAMLPSARTNVWTVEITPTRFVYQLQRVGSDRRVRVEFDVIRPIAVPPAPWGFADR